MTAITISEVFTSVSMLFKGYDSYLFMAFTLMCASSVLVLIRRLLVGVKQ